MFFRLKAALILAIWTLPACGAGVDEQPPSPAPDIQGVFPHGGMRGSSVQVRISGRNLKDVASIRFSDAGIRGEIVERRDTELAVRIGIDSSAEPGRHDFRLIGPAGSNIAWFDVGGLREVTETEPNDSLEQAQAITLPVLVNGIVEKGDYDFFRFTVQAGETLTFDLNGTRNGSPLDGVLALYDSGGEQLAYNDDYYIFKDPHLVSKFEKAGTYFVRLNGSEESGSHNSDYRLTIGAMPWVSHALPSGGQRGQTTTVRLEGVNLGGITEVTLGPGLAHAAVTRASGNQAEVRLTIPKTIEPGVYWLHAGGAAEPAPFVVGDLPEIPASANPARDTPQEIRLPAVVNGVLNVKGEAHYFRFHVSEPGKYVLAADSMRLGFPLDPLVSLHDADGRRIAYQDEPNTNNGLQPSNLDPHLVVDIPAAGDYTARIRDFAYRGSPDFVYRFTIKRAEPDFEVRVHIPDETLFRGRENRIKVRIRRLEGWDSPVEIRAENLPVGIAANTEVADPKNSTYLGGCADTHIIDGTDVEVAIRVAQDSPPAQQELRFIARGVQNGKTVEKEAWTRYRWHGRAWQDAETGRLLATIADAPLLVLDTPGALKLSSGTREGSFELPIRRFDGGTEPLVLAAGKDAERWEITADPVPSSVTKTKVKVRLRAGPVPAALVLTGTAGDKVLGESREIPLQVETDATKNR